MKIQIWMICFSHIWMLTNCKSSADPEPSSTELNQSTQQVQEKPRTLMRALAFPRSSRISGIRKSLSQNTPLTAEQYNQCREQIAQFATQVRSEDDMLQQLERVRQLISLNIELYHNCFLMRVLEIDQKLKGSKATFRNQSKEFLSEMKQLWLQARALDHLAAAANISKVRYFTLLRIYYLRWSHAKFGRPLSIEGKPLDQWPQHIERSSPPATNPEQIETGKEAPSASETEKQDSKKDTKDEQGTEPKVNPRFGPPLKQDNSAAPNENEKKSSHDKPS